MSIKRNFSCDDCGSTVTVNVKSKEFNSSSDIRVCPVCASPIPYDEVDDADEE